MLPELFWFKTFVNSRLHEGRKSCYRLIYHQFMEQNSTFEGLVIKKLFKVLSTEWLQNLCTGLVSRTDESNYACTHKLSLTHTHTHTQARD